jgi:hypothetical protein
MADLPIFCSLTPEALEARRQGLLSALLSQSSGREILAEGLRLRFEASSETLSSIVRAVDAERRCCRFLRFTITVDGVPRIQWRPRQRRFSAASNCSGLTPPR